MPLNYIDLQKEITHLGEATVHRRTELAERLQRCRAVLHEQADNLKELQHLVAETAGREKGLRCALPVSERLEDHFPVKANPANYTILSADGSQITPDPHAAVFYGLINIGVFRMTNTPDCVPQTHSWSELIYENEDPEQQEYLSEDLINLRRDTREREIMAQLAKQESAPLITLTDGPLELYHEPRGDSHFESYFRNYLAALDDLALLRCITAGYVDRPRAALLTATLGLVESSKNQTGPTAPFAGVSDLMLMEELLHPGERSAVFALQFRDAEKFDGKKALHFFYLNTGNASLSSIARVEIPLWVVETPGALDQLHAVLVEQAGQAGAHPYPYALIRAHETAVVKMDEHDALEQMIQQELMRRGLHAGAVSQKLNNKLIGKRTRY